jgi:hypothetical protein
VQEQPSAEHPFHPAVRDRPRPCGGTGLDRDPCRSPDIAGTPLCRPEDATHLAGCRNRRHPIWGHCLRATGRDLSPRVPAFTQHVRPFRAVRIFFPGLPHSWRSIRNNVGKTPVVASFQAPPAEILSGRYDHQLTHWFRTAPKDRLTRWNYWHEPEDDIERGSLNAAAYRRAFTHIERLSDRAHNFRLRSTLILMCWTAEKNSGRSVRTYYPGDAVIDVMAWDCYNAGHRANRYRAPRELFRPAYRASRLRSNNFAVAELGSVVVNGDTGARRARWLHTVAHYLRRHGASFCTYFDSNVGVDYRLSDRPSRRAWRGIVHSQWG